MDGLKLGGSFDFLALCSIEYKELAIGRCGDPGRKQCWGDAIQS
jgi:hypothetical protein